VGIKRRGKGALEQLVLKLFFYNRLQAQSVRNLAAYDYQGLPVEVDVLPKHLTRQRLAPTPGGELPIQRTRNRPIVGGLSIGPLEQRLRGTLGCFVRKNDDPRTLYVLSNAHVLAAVDQLRTGAPIAHPAWELRQAARDDVFAELAELDVPLRLSGQRVAVVNTMDAALARMTVDRDRIRTGVILGEIHYILELRP
jgi:hypothetical protein